MSNACQHIEQVGILTFCMMDSIIITSYYHLTGVYIWLLLSNGWFGVMSGLKKFTSVTIFILAYKETNLLKQTINEVLSKVKSEDLEKIIVVFKSDNCPSSYEIRKSAELLKHPKIETYIQKAPNLELCLAELPLMVKSSHFIIMTADMEMHPQSVAHMVTEAKKQPETIICAAKWMKGSVVENYGFVHQLGSRALNLFIAMLFNRNIKDPVTFFQIYPTTVYHKMNFDSPKNMVYEYTVKPLREGVGYIEIPTVYKKRTEGNSNFDAVVLIKGAIKYILAAIKIRFKLLGLS